MSLVYCECPYCDYENEVELENQNELEDYKKCCCNCKKCFIYRISYSVDIITSQIKGELTTK